MKRGWILTQNVSTKACLFFIFLVYLSGVLLFRASTSGLSLLNCTLSSLLTCRLSIPLRVDSKFFRFETFLEDDVRVCSDETTGELLWPLEILRSAPGLASEFWGRDKSDSPLNINGSRLLDTAGRLDDPLERKNCELDNCTSPRTMNKLTKV